MARAGPVLPAAGFGDVGRTAASAQSAVCRTVASGGDW
jgi:hypothetical protein